MTDENGFVPINLSPLDQKMLDEMQAVLEGEAGREAQLRQELERLVDRRRRYERAIAIIKGEKLGAGGKPESKLKRPDKPRVRTNPSGISEERMEMLRRVILEIATESEEFRQVDVRARVQDAGLAKSSVTATGFKLLREEGFIRLARQSGNNKWFRLTRTAAGVIEPEDDDGES